MKDKPILHSERPASNRRACKECFQALRWIPFSWNTNNEPTKTFLKQKCLG
jgi:hypothetical protein